MEMKEIESKLEGILFASGEPVSIARLCALLEIDAKTLDTAAAALADGYRFDRRGIRLVKMDKLYQLVSAPEYAELIRRALEERRPPPMSKPALEVLAIVAYFQPTTRAYIDQTRGVDSAGTVLSLLEKGLLEECGRLDVPGRPALLRTTPVFLRSFGIASLDELPSLTLSDSEAEGQLTIPGAESEQ